MQIHVLFFGACREAAAADECQLVIEATQDVKPDVASAFSQLRESFPRLAEFERSLLFAVNEEHARRDHPLHDGDTLALFPPVSGG